MAGRVTKQRAATRQGRDKGASKTRAMVLRTIALCVLSLAVGIGVGIVMSPHVQFSGESATLAGRTTVEEGELDLVLGIYTVDEEKTTVTVREAIEETSSLESAKNSDGTYDMPTADAVLAIARNNILEKQAADKDIVATEEDAAAYAEETLGTSDYSVIASSYNMSAEQVAEHMLHAATIAKLRDEVVTTKAIDKPTPPAEPAADKRDEPTAEYAKYVFELVGDEWDANANTWAREDGPYREALKDFTLSNDGVTYACAQAAYYVAYERHAAVEQQISDEWTTYVNGFLSNVSVELGTLVA